MCEPLRTTDVSAVAGRAAAIAHPLFVKYGWRYGENVPTVRELADCIEGLVSRCGPDFGDANASGRFYVERRPDGLEVHLNLGTVEK